METFRRRWSFREPFYDKTIPKEAFGLTKGKIIIIGGGVSSGDAFEKILGASLCNFIHH